MAQKSTQQKAQPRQAFSEDAAPAFRYYVEMKSVIEAAFTECSGLNLERDVYQIKEGGVNDFVHTLSGRAIYTGNITLKRGITYSDALWSWFQEGLIKGMTTFVSMAIILIIRFDHKAQKRVALRWDVKNAFPVKWSGPTLTMTSTDVAVETIEIAHQGLTVQKLEF